MGKPLAGKTIALTASRKVEEMSTLIEKQGGNVIVRPMQGTVYVAKEEIVSELKEMIDQGVDWFVLTTGIGTEKLVELAEEIGLKDELIERLRHAKIAARGYKTKNALKKLGLTADISDEDGTTNGLIRAMESNSFKGSKVAVQLHGIPSPNLRTFFESEEAEVVEVLPYRHIAPDEEKVKTLYEEVVEGKVDAVCFTTFLQVRALFQYAESIKKEETLLNQFNKNVLAVAVGKVTAEALTDAQVTRVIVPERERMGAMIIELAKFMDADE
ncbi:uroporphyrinogen-III synthase [Alkalihalophilus pseudofirmus OF4]|uniref:Uroporphyrinogen-III synthase n=1 Tax=Alkalihalophilus pseudofirmus (strain ATCC BAA-2126 / JCM 17055 / OF4) TaxID=398511 RepID=D3FSR8_ALKPO|nr:MULTISPECIES: uroporphyrinogen-III synthase [Alkalihalophilus]ADC51783.1 uroporphyrinogen-III synthase [Alkalihalophilus pseudofirmus OF4]MED1603568.1 uroporphyrinogen-III synthase [Alkalihalophilus marmarensis]